MKKIIRGILKKTGFELRRIEKDIFNIKLYNNYYSKGSIENKRFYNVGAGNFYHPYWTNIDYISDWYKTNNNLTSKGIHHDLFSLSPIAIDDDVAEIVYSSHTIEHIKDEHAQYFFNEAYRILKKGGLFRITAPDIDLHYNAYINNDIDFYYWRNWYSKEKDYNKIGLTKPLNDATIAQLFLLRFATASSTLHIDGIKERINDDQLQKVFNELKYEEALNYCSEKCSIEIQKKYPGNHTNWWNRDKTISMLKESGFNKINISGYSQSQSPVLRNNCLFDSTHPKISLYIEAIK